METKLSFNEFLYQKRMEMGLSRKKFAKFLKIPSFFYRYYEIGYVKPSSKYVKRISEALNVDYSEYLVGISSYPADIEEPPSRFEIWYRNILSKLWARIVLAVLMLCSIGVMIAGFAKYNYTMDHAREFYCERYLEFADGVREKGGRTFSLLHEMVRPEIHSSEEDRFISISASSNDYAMRSMNAYAVYKGENEATYYIVPNSANQSLETLNVQYIDYTTLTKYISTFSIKDNKFLLDENEIRIEGASENVAIPDETKTKVIEKMKANVNNVNKDFTSLIKDKLGMDYDFYGELLVDHQKGATSNLWTEVISLAAGIFGIALTGGFLFAILFALFFGISKKKRMEKVTKPIVYERVLKEPRKDIRFFPFIPETVFEIIGIILILFGSVRVIFNVYALFANNAISQATYDQTSIQLFMYFTLGMFLLYFIDFDIFMDDERSLRNFFLYGIVFFGLYIVECVLIEYLERTRGAALLATTYYVIPNNFGTISCYFGIMFFLFYNPKWANTKKKLICFRLMSILPILWITISSTIFQNYKEWGWNMNTWQLYFFDSERPQFSILCITYLVGLFFLRLYFKRKYGEVNATKMFNGNRFYFLKNILISLIILVMSLMEFIFRNLTNNVKGMGKYWQIVFLVPFLFFYHPHLGKRNKPVDYFTLILYFIFFGIGYLVAGFMLLAMLIQ